MVGSVSWWLILGVSTNVMPKEIPMGQAVWLQLQFPNDEAPGFRAQKHWECLWFARGKFCFHGNAWDVVWFCSMLLFFFLCYRHFFPRRFFQKQSFHVFLPDACFTSQHASRILIPIGSKTMSYNELLLQRRNLCYIYISMYMRSLSVCTCFKVSTWC